MTLGRIGGRDVSKYGRIIRYALRQRRGLVLIGVLSCAAAGVAVLSPWPLKLLVDGALGSEGVPGVVERVLARVGLRPTAGVVVGFAAVASLVVFLFTSAIESG